MIGLFTDIENLPPSFIPQIVVNNANFHYVESVEESDFVLLPFWEVLYEYSDKQYLSHSLDPTVRSKVQKSVDGLLAKAREFNKQVLVINWSDDEKEIPIENAVFFRTSLYMSRRRPNEFAFPSWNGDLITDFNKGKPDIRKKSNKPYVGFRGSSRPLGITLFDLYRYNLNYVNRALSSFRLSLVPRHQWNQGQILRKKAMTSLMGNRQIRTDFKVITRGYINQRDPSAKRFNRNRFVENIFNNDYVLCVRGAGNYSFRFYETLSAGRIPLFINTDCVLPLDFQIDWKKYCVWVEESDVNKIDQILLDFHNDLSDDDFQELQVNIRKIWDEHICPTAFYSNMECHFRHIGMLNPNAE